MQSLKNLWIGLIVVGIIAITALFTPVGKQIAQSQSFGNVINGNFTTYNGLYVNTSTNQVRTGSETDGNGQNIMSVQRLAMTSGTTTPCSMLSPAATSTLLSYSFMPTVGTTTSSTFTLATSTTAFATSTGVIVTTNGYVPMNSFTYIPGLTTNIANVPPSTWVNVSLSAATSNTGGFVMTGFCTANFLTQ